MSIRFKTVITTAGAAKLAAATTTSGQKVNLTHMAVGDGNGNLPEPSVSQTALIHEVWRGTLNKITQNSKAPNQVIAELVIPPEVGGFWMRELGLYDSTGTLIAVASMAESYKPLLTEGSGRAMTCRMIIIISDVNAVSLSVDSTTIMATQDYVDDKLAEHEQSRRHPDASLTQKGFTQLSSATNSDSESVAATPKAIKTLNDTKAPLKSPALTGTPTAPTAAQGTNNTQIATTAYVRAAISALVGSSPEALDTLNELAAALGNDPNFATTMTNALAGKQPLDATLTALAGLATGANKLPYFTGTDTVSQTDLTSVGRDILAKTSVLAVIQYLGLRELGTSGEKIPLLSTANTWSARQTFSAGITGTLTGNADTATKLKTARKINGVAFDGSADITLTPEDLGLTDIASQAGNAVQRSGDTMGGQLKIGTINALRIFNQAFGLIFRRSEEYLHLIPTNEGEGENGDIGPLRPFSINLRTGLVSIGNGVKVGGGITGNLTGNADTATKLKTARTIGGVSFDGSANIDLPGVNKTGNQSTTGNAATATKLQTARTIGGVAFDGTANINLPGVNIAGNQNTTGNAATATKLQTARTINGVSFDGTANISLSPANIGCPASPTGWLGTGSHGASITTAQLVTILQNNGAFNTKAWVARCAWAYADSASIPDSETGCGIIPLAGAVIEVFSHSATYYTIRITTATTTSVSGALTNAEFIYVFNGTAYSPGWRRAYNTKNKPTAADVGALPTTGGTLTGGLTAAGEIISKSANGLRIAYGNYGFFIRNDGSSTYFMLTNSGDSLGTWNSLRPLTINNANGAVSIGNGLNVTGGINGSLNGNASTATKLQTARKISGVAFDGSADITLKASHVGAFALGKTGDTVANDKAVGWNWSSGAYNATISGASTLILHFYMGEGSCPAAQFRINYKNGGIFYRSARDGYGFEADWSEFYTTTRKPSASDVGAYTKSESDSRYALKTACVTSVRLGAYKTHTMQKGVMFETAGYVITGLGIIGEVDGDDPARLRPLQYCINGTWYTAATA